MTTTEPTLASRPPDSLSLPPNTVLLCIDLQQGFQQFRGRNNPELEANVTALQSAWRDAGRPLWHVRHDSREPKSVFRPGEPGNAHMPAFAPRPGEPLFTKHVHSALIGTGLEAALRKAKVDTVVMCGIQTNYCVASTASMAGNLGFTTFVVGDACATFPQTMLDGSTTPAQTVHDVALAELHGEFATVTTTRAVLDHIRALRATPA